MSCSTLQALPYVALLSLYLMFTLQALPYVALLSLYLVFTLQVLPYVALLSLYLVFYVAGAALRRLAHRHALLHLRRHRHAGACVTATSYYGSKLSIIIQPCKQSI